VTVAVADLERVITYQSLPERLLITCPGLLRFSKVIREVRPDEFGSRATGRGFRRGVHVGDLAVVTDGHKRIEAGLDQASVVGVCKLCFPRQQLYLAFRPLEFSNALDGAAYQHDLAISIALYFTSAGDRSDGTVGTDHLQVEFVRYSRLNGALYGCIESR
jgi:hypothetical protein